MKILGRILIILVAALVVVGAATALAGSSSNMQFSERQEFIQDQPSAGTADSGETRPRDHFSEEGRDSPSLFGIVSVIQNLVIIGGIVLLITVIRRLKIMLARLVGSFHNI